MKTLPTEITKLQGTDFFTALITLATLQGIKEVENLIYNTYCKAEANVIIEKINLFLSFLN